MILANESLILANESLILANESLILANESLILANESLILANESLILANESLILTDADHNSTPLLPCFFYHAQYLDFGLPRLRSAQVAQYKSGQVPNALYSIRSGINFLD
ncbi:hypothetical protein PQG02_26655 [Nostoc sp. UHCC 0926]|uniref:hypothetical protein n=1 Tax=unclassified Nostoc TaxID=2593658 RepID=UPI0023620F18|nr:hypothetical protein [Nostoc sp. UHCC 0926]WDD32211.1 hypothetical protein PQG02_26655 [Nostoc sp. UHCC 0926]